VTGGHFNPAVTMGVFVKDGKENFQNNLLYVLSLLFSQILGAAAGVGISFMVMHTYIDKPLKVFPQIAVLCPNNSDINTLDKCDGQGMYHSFFIAEMIGTFVFVNVILSVKYHNGAKDLVVNALGIGVTLMLSVTITGGISGGCINPAVGLIQSIYQNFIIQEYPETFPKNYSKNISLISTWVYVLAPLLGGILAGAF
jgi:glycerol uptake facilitator-like aquaporin